MRIIPRRKRTWLLVLLGVAIVGAAGIWWAASEKSEFEAKYVQLNSGMPFAEAMSLVDGNGVTFESTSFQDGSTRHMRCVMTNDDGERIELVFTGDRLTEKEFTPMPEITRLRRLWNRVLGSNPPF